MDSDIRKMIQSSIFAPSGENCQPWKFIVTGNIIQLINLPERDQSLYSWGQRASYMANGAAIENLLIAASELGYKTKVTLFPNTQNQNIIADIELNTESNVEKSSLYKYIPERSTNRKAYDTKPLPENIIKELAHNVVGDNVKILFTQKEDDKESLGKAGSTNESVMFSNKYLHNFFFSHVNWTKEEDDEKKIGFFIDTLELPPPAKIGLKVFKNWNITNILNKIGLYKMIGKQNAATNSASSGFGVIVIKDKTPESFVYAGRTLQRVWLTATKLDLSLQPLTGVLFFMYRIIANETDKFTLAQINAIKSAYGDIARIFNVPASDTIAFMFRVGIGGKPSARSTRFSVDEVAEFK